MPPYQPVLSVSRSQSMRIGRGPGSSVVPEINSGDTLIHPDTGALQGPLYVDLGNPFARRDYQHHQAVGGMVDVPIFSSTAANQNPLTTYTDLFSPIAGLALSNGAGFGINVSAGIIQSRYTGGQIVIPATTVTPAAPPVAGGRIDSVVISSSGVVSVVTGAADTVAPTYDVWTLATTGAGTSFKLQWTYDGFIFTTAAITATGTTASVATAIQGATGGPGNNASTFLAAANGTGLLAPLAAIATTGAGPLGSGTVTITASGMLEGPIPFAVVSNIGVVVTLTHTTVGVGAAVPPIPSGDSLILGNVYVPSTATTSANYVYAAGPLMTS